MRTRNAKAIRADERAHIDAVKQLACSVCDHPGPGDAHHIEQGNHFTVVALCEDCHRGQILGWHGQKRMWAIKRMNELDALAVTIKRLAYAAKNRTKETA